MLYILIWDTFRVVPNMSLKGTIVGPFWTQIVSQSSGLWSLFQTFYWCLLQVLLAVCGIWASNAQFEAVLGNKISKNSGLRSFSPNVFPGFISVLLNFLIASNFRCVENKNRRGPFYEATLVTKISQNSGLWQFSKKTFTGYTSVLVYLSIWVTFRGVLNIGLRGPISGSFGATKYNLILVFSHFIKFCPLVSHTSYYAC